MLMKKASSTEALNSLGEREPTGRRIRRSASLGRPITGFGRGRKVSIASRSLLARPGMSIAVGVHNTNAESVWCHICAL